jgi:hypothetical protein
MNMNELSQCAKRWREANGYSEKLGVVVIFGDEVQGWVNELRDPQHWQPGCIAIDEFGLFYKTVGGDPQTGAVKWQVLDRF